jgi:histidinol-phosphate aminotransferase
MKVPDDMEIVLGNGSDELIQMLALAVAGPSVAMLGLEPSFAMFRLVACHTAIRYVGVDLDANFAIDRDRTLAQIARDRPALLFIAYPNNPTGNLFSVDTIADIIDAFPGLVVIDEAYHPFAQRTLMSKLNDFPNLLLMRTVSKLGLAGLRLGMLVGSERWLQHIDKVRLPYNVNVLTQLAAAEALKHAPLLEFQAAAIREQRVRVANELRAISDAVVYPSDANFILFRINEAGRIFNALKARRILIKNVNGSHPLLTNCLRVTIGTPEENNQFLAALSESV